VQFIDCNLAAHGADILAILNDAIVTSTALYDYEPRSMQSMASWFAAKAAGNFPVIGALEAGVLVGFVSFGTFRAYPAYKYSVEHSVYVHRDHRGRGIGDRLLTRIIDVAKEQERHLLIGAIDAANTASIRLHEKHGFVHSGTIKQAGFKFGRWLDVAFYQLTLPTPQQPQDG
jgi:phosphinothricin acetyltransferase